MRTFTEWTKGWSPPERVIAGILTMVALGVVQHVAPARMSFTAFFLLATAIVAWLSGRYLGLLLGLIAVGMTLREEWVDARGTPQAWVVWLNAVTRLASFSCVAWVVDGWRQAVWELEDRVATRTASLRQEIAERERVEARLRESVALFEQLAGHIKDVFWMSNVEKSEIVYVSPSYQRIWGRPTQDLYESPTAWLEAVYPEDSGRVAHAAQTKQASGQYDEEYRIARPDGSLRWIRDRAFPIRDAEGEVYRIAGMAEDITDRKAAEKSLREKDEQIREIITGAPVILLSVNRRGIVTFRDGAGLKHRGVAPGTGVGRSVEEVFADEPTVVAWLRRALAGEMVESEVESSGLWFQFRFAPQLNAQGEVLLVIGVAVDITERKRMERRLGVLHAVTQVLAESPTVAVASGRILRAVGAGLGWAAGAFWKEDAVPGLLRCTETWVAEPDRAAGFGEKCHGRTLERGAGAAGAAWADDAVVCLEIPAAGGSEAADEWMTALSASQVVAFPVNHQGKTFGVIEFFVPDASPPGAELRQLLESVGAQFGQFLARKAVEEATQMQAFVLEHMADGIMATDANGFIRITNSALCRQTGYRKEELFDQHVSLFSPGPEEEATRQFHAILEQVEATGRWSGELPQRRLDGSVFPAHVTLARLEMGGRTLLVSLHRDLSERKQAEEAMQTQALMLENMGEGVVLCDEQGIIHYTNPAMDRIFEWARGELMGRELASLRPATAESAWPDREEAMAALDRGEEWTGHFHGRTRQGRDILCDLRISNLPVNGKRRYICLFLDITARHQAEVALAQKEELYRTLFELCPDGVLVEDAEGNLVDANQAVARITGYPREELLGRNVRCFTPPELQPEIGAHLAALLAGQPLAHTVWNVRQDGSRCLLELHETRIALPDGSPGILSMSRDVTESHKAKLSLAASEERFRSLVNNLNVGVYRNTPGGRGRFLQANPALARLHGYDSVEEFMATSVAEHYEDPEARGQFLAELMARGTVADYELRLRRRDGALMQASVIATAHRGADGQVDWIDGVLEDITARKRAAEALRESEERFRTLAQATFEGVALSKQGRILDCNDQMGQILGYTRDELLGRNVADFARTENREAVNAGLREGREVAGEFEILCKDGSRRVVEIHGRSPAGPEAMRITTVRDITEHRRAEAEIREREERLRLGLRAARLVIWDLDTEAGAIRYSDNAAEFLGGEDIAAYCALDTMLPLIHPDDRDGLTQALQRALEDDLAFESEYRARMLDGNYRWILAKGRAVADHRAPSRRILGVSMDLTERKEAAEMLRLQRDLSLGLSTANELQPALEQLLRAATQLPGVDSGGVYVVDQRQGALDLAAHIGLSAEFVRRVSHYEPDAPQARLVRTGNPVYAALTQLPAPIGDVCRREGLLSLAAIPIRHDARTLAVINFASRTHVEIPERSRLAIEIIAAQATGALVRIETETARRESEQRLRALIQSAPVVLFAGDNRGYITLEDGRALEALGFRPGEHVGKHALEAFGGSPAVAENVRRGLAGEEFSSLVALGSNALEVWIAPSRGPAQAVDGFIGVAVNVTDRLRLERQILEISDREQARIGQDIHDGLCQQLVSVAFDANALEHLLSAQARPEAATARKICALLDQAITESRQVSRGLYPVRLEAEGLASALEELAGFTGERFRIPCVFEGELPPGCPEQSAATHFYRIAQEAVTNAVKHSGAKLIRISVRRQDDQLELKVEDDGRGFAEDSLVHRGMGLHIMRYRSRSLRGRLAIDPRPGGGTVISCCAPCHGH